MTNWNNITTTDDISISIDNTVVAVVQSYKVLTTRSAKAIQAFGHSAPVGTIHGAENYTLELSRIYATETAVRDGLNFYDLKDFTLNIRKPDRTISYSGCQWVSLEESAEVGGVVLERVTVTAGSRVEVPHTPSAT